MRDPAAVAGTGRTSTEGLRLRRRLPVPFSSAVKYFRDEIIQHQKEGGCPFDPAATTLWADR